jgi:TetR/AcrR family transcriptional repressor of uid operon
VQHKISTKDRIVASAKQLFSERGFHRTAMADLAEYAQVSVGTIYRSFTNKSEIIRAIILADTEETLGQLQADIDQVRDGRIVGPMAIERMILRWVSKRTDALDHEIVAEGHRNPEVSDMISGIGGQYRELFRTLAMLLQPDLDDIEIEGAAELLLACLFGMGNREFTTPRLDEDQTAAIVTKLILRGLNIRTS